MLYCRQLELYVRIFFRDPIPRECYEAIEQLAKEAADLASEWDVEHNFSHFFDDDWEEESPQTPRT